MKSAILKLASMSLCAILLVACKKEVESVGPKNPSTNTQQENPAQKIVLGEKLENPYSIKNMQQAYINVTSNARISTGASPVHVTHLYMRFLPKDWHEYDVLKSDTILKLYQIPLDYEITTFGNSY